MHDHRWHRNDIVFAACQQRRIFGQLPGIDLACGDTPEDVVGAGKLFTLAMLLRLVPSRNPCWPAAAPLAASAPRA
jgi:hypothetical protein